MRPKNKSCFSSRFSWWFSRIIPVALDFFDFYCGSDNRKWLPKWALAGKWSFWTTVETFGREINLQRAQANNKKRYCYKHHIKLVTEDKYYHGSQNIKKIL